MLVWLFLSCALRTEPTPPVVPEEVVETAASFPETHYDCPQRIVAAVGAGMLHPDVLTLIEPLAVFATVEWPEDFDAAEQLVLTDKNWELKAFQRRAAGELRSSDDPRFERSVLLMQSAGYIIHAGLLLDSPKPEFLPEARRGGWRRHLMALHDALLVQANQRFLYMQTLPGKKLDVDLMVLAQACADELGIEP